MKKFSLRVISVLVLMCMVAAMFAACTPKEDEPKSTEPIHVDYVAQTKLDMDSDTLKQEVQWGRHSHIDGDTSHFEVPKSFDVSGTVKARYLAVNTPESTGQIQEWGKAASRYTKEKLSTAHSIVIESDDNSWNFDGNGRYLVWIWYQPAEGEDYRCLNIELLQAGLGVGSSASEGRYGTAAVAAINQATQEKLYIFSGKKDPEFPYGEAASVTLRELRTNVKDYEGKKVAVEGIITYNSDYTAYLESYDAETEMYYGMQIFYGYNSQLINVLAQGAEVRIVGVVSEFYGTYQISGLTYNRMKPEDPANTAQISKDNPIAFTEVSAYDFNGPKTVMVGEEEKTFSYAELAVSTSISMKNLQVVDTYTTTNPSASDVGAMTLTCMVDGERISVRTEVLKDADGNLITEDAYAGKTIDVQGIVDCYDGNYQIRVMSVDDITVH
ncbi:MAG: thermonuclease family protein [Oscillospiraceae bacterium]|nr:thermonuclease family protein [Oscillospiraceae bacterium]